MEKLRLIRPGRNHYDTWEAELRVELGPERPLYADGMERDVYVNGRKIGTVERVMKQSRRNFRISKVDGWRARASFTGRSAETINGVRLLEDTQVHAVATLVNTYAYDERA